MWWPTHPHCTTAPLLPQQGLLINPKLNRMLAL
jgi:hypothetical protein